MIGWYPPLISKAHNNDCYSNFFSLGTSMFTFAAYFDKMFDINSAIGWIVIIGDLGVHGFSIYTTMDVCLKQLNMAKATPDQDLTNNFLSKDKAKSPKVGGWETM